MVLEEPFLDGSQRRRSADCCLIGLDLSWGCGGGSQFSDRLVLEDLRGAQAQPCLLGLRHDLDAENRIATQLEEVVMDADTRDPENVLPNFGQSDFGRRGWRFIWI